MFVTDSSQSYSKLEAEQSASREHKGVILHQWYLYEAVNDMRCNTQSVQPIL